MAGRRCVNEGWQRRGTSSRRHDRNDDERVAAAASSRRSVMIARRLQAPVREIRDDRR